MPSNSLARPNYFSGALILAMTVIAQAAFVQDEENRVQIALRDLPDQARHTQSSAPEAVPGHRLRIHLYNLADVSSRNLDHAMQAAARILATAGVDPIWQQGSAAASEAHTVDQTSTVCQKNRQPDTRDYVVLIIVRDLPVRCFRGALGYALPDARIGANATIFYDRIERLNDEHDIDVGKVLGHAMAHEIGHVLLGSKEHSPAGIMKSPWNKADIQYATVGLMKFTPLQRGVIQERVCIRVTARLRH